MGLLRSYRALLSAALLCAHPSEGRALSARPSPLHPRSWALARSAAAPRASPAAGADKGAAPSGPTALALEQAAAFLNAELPEFVLELARAYTPAGEAERKANVWSRGAYVLEGARVLELGSRGLRLESTVSRRRAPGTETEAAAVQWLYGAEAADDDGLLLQLLRLANALGRPRDGGALLRLPLGSRGTELPPNWRLNATPHPPAVRARFYAEVSAALAAALAAPDCPSRLLLTVQPPELNQGMDVYRGATLLELTRELALRLATGEGTGRARNVRVCVQAAMGQGVFTGLPRAISGLRNMLEAMDWGGAEGGPLQGLLGQSGEAEGRPAGRRFEGGPDEGATRAGATVGRVRFGAVESGVAMAGDEVLLVLAPQSMQAVDIVGPLQRLVAEAEALGAVVVLLNPALGDVPSAAGVMQVKGRGERIAFGRSFREAYSFRCLYYAGRFAFPIVGALRFSLADAPFWTVYRRWEGAQCGRPGVDELYEPVAAYAAEGGAAGVDSVDALLRPPPPAEEITRVLDPKVNVRAGAAPPLSSG